MTAKKEYNTHNNLFNSTKVAWGQKVIACFIGFDQNKAAEYCFAYILTKDYEWLFMSMSQDDFQILSIKTIGADEALPFVQEKLISGEISSHVCTEMAKLCTGNNAGVSRHDEIFEKNTKGLSWHAGA